MDSLLVLWHSGACRSSSAQVFKAVKQSDVPAARCLFKMIHRFIFSWKWEHCSHLLVNFEAFFFSFGRQRRIPFFHHLSVIQHGQFFFSFPSLWLGDSFAKAFTLWSWCIREFTFLFADLLLAGFFFLTYCYV